MPSFGSHYIATIFYNSMTTEKSSAPRSQSNCLILNTSRFTGGPTYPGQVPANHSLRDEVRHLVRYHGQNLLYLDHDGWICSIDFEATATISRHFFLRNDWLVTNTGLIIDVNLNGDIVFAKKDEIAVF